MSIVPADGWVKDEAFYIVGTQYSYADTDAAPETTILLDVRFKFGQTDDAFIQSAKEGDELIYKQWNPVISDITPVKIGGIDAKEYYIETDLGTQHRMIFICRGSNVYHIHCAAYTENFDIVKDDFQKMLDSFTLQ